MSLTQKQKKAYAISVNRGWFEVVSNFLDITQAYQKIGKHVPSPLRQGKNGDGFRLLPRFDECGEAVDNSLGFCSNGLDLVALAIGGSREDAADAIIGLYEGENQKITRKVYEKPVMQPVDELTKDAKIKALNTLMSSCVHNPEAIQSYMKSRGVEVPDKYVPSNVFYSQDIPVGLKKNNRTKKLKGLVCAVTSKEGRLRTSHRIFLDDSFAKNKSLKKSKLLMPAPEGVKGGLIRAYPVVNFPNDLFVPGVKGFTEGLEDAIVCTIQTKVPCSAGISSTILANADFEEEFHTGIIFADNDNAGRKAAYKLAKKLMMSNKRAIILFPYEKGLDWNDAYVKKVRFPDVNKISHYRGKVIVHGDPNWTWANLKKEYGKEPYVNKKSAAQF